MTAPSRPDDSNERSELGERLAMIRDVHERTSTQRLLVAAIAMLVILAVAACVLVPRCHDEMSRDLCAGTVAVALFVSTLIALLVVGRTSVMSGIALITAPLLVLEPPPKSSLSA